MPTTDFSRHFREIHRLATSSYPNMDAHMEDYLHIGQELFGMPIGIISRIENDEYTILAISGSGISLKNGDVVELSQTICSGISRTRQTMIFERIPKDLDAGTLTAYEPLHPGSYIGAPIIVDGMIFGTINFLSPESREEKFQDMDREVLELMAVDLGRIIFLQKKALEQEESDQYIKLLSEAVEASNDGIVISDPNRPDNPVIYVNKAFEKITGYSTADILGRNCRFLQGPDRDQQSVLEIRNAIKEIRSCHVRLKNFKKNGEVFWNDFRLSPIFDNNNILKYYVGVQTDVTVDVNKERLLTTVSGQRKELMHIAEEILAVQSEEEMVQIIAGRLSNIFLFDTAAIYVVDESEKMLRPIAVLGPSWTSPDLDEWKVPLGTGIIGSIIASKNGELVNNSHLDPRSIYPKGADIRKEHLIVQPLRSGEKVWGAFIINRMSDEIFSEQEYEIVQFLTSYASLALENISLLRKIKESEQSQRTILETISDGVISIDHRGKVFYANKGIEQIFGYRSEELVGNNLEILIPSGLRASHHKGLKQYSSTGVKNLPHWHAVSLPGLHKLGHEIPLEISFGESNTNGKRVFTGIIRDITERKKAEEHLNATTTRLTSLIQTIQAGVLVEDETRHISLINTMFCRMFSIPAEPDQLLGADCSNSAEQSKILFTDPDQFIETIDALLLKKEVVTNDELRLVDGRTFERDYIPITVDGVYKGHMWLYRDITARKQNELEIEKLARFPSENPNPIIRIAPDFQILYTNPPGKQMLAEVGEISMDKIPGSWRPIIESTLSNRKTTEFEIATEKGTPIYLTHFVPVFPEGYVNMYGRNITEQKEAEWESNKAKRIAEESMRAKQDFLAKMSHELRTPMNAVLGLTNLMLNTSMTNEQSSLISGIKSSGKNLLVIINDILDLAKIEAGKMQIDRSEFILSDMLENIRISMQPLADQKRIELHIDVAPNVPEVLIGDPVRLGQIIINLLSNSIKFTDEGQVLMTCRFDASVSTAKFTIKDTGIGIPEQKLQSIFESFSQVSQDISVRYGGTGLGLTIVKQLLTLMGGDIQVRSVLGEGSTFTVTLPVTVSPLKKINISSKTDFRFTFHSLSGRILLVEDNPTNQLVAVKTLEQWSITVDVASDGYTALDLLARNDYNLVLMDIQMPGIDGFETTRRIRQDLPEPKRSIPIFAMTASVLYDPEQRAINAGMNGYISKPFEPEDLYRKVVPFMTVGTILGEPTENEKQKTGGYKHLDTSTLERLAPESPEFVREMIRLFDTQTPLYLEKMTEALRKNDLKTVKSIAHTMKPTGAYIGVEALKPIVAMIEEQAEKNGDRAGLDHLMKKLDILCEEIFNDISLWKKNNETPLENS